MKFFGKVTIPFALLAITSSAFAGQRVLNLSKTITSLLNDSAVMAELDASPRTKDSVKQDLKNVKRELVQIQAEVERRREEERRRREEERRRREMIADCKDEIQYNIVWDGRSNSKWADRNLKRMCNNTKSVVGPAECFAVVRSFSPAGGAEYLWDPAVKACANKSEVGAAKTICREYAKDAAPGFVGRNRDALKYLCGGVNLDNAEDRGECFSRGAAIARSKKRRNPRFNLDQYINSEVIGKCKFATNADDVFKYNRNDGRRPRIRVRVKPSRRRPGRTRHYIH